MAQQLLTDVAVDMAHAGSALDLSEWSSLAWTHPGQWRDLAIHRYCRVLFSSPMWGVLFDEGD